MSTAVQPAVHVQVPENAYAGDVPLVGNMRGGYVSAVHRGTAAVANAEGDLMLALGNVQQPAFLRSSAKPFQTIAAVLSGGIDRFGIDQRELAVLCSSHAAEPRHMEAVLSALEKAGLGEDYLRCGIHPPMHEATAQERIRAGVAPSPVCNNCSGVHSGMLIACKAMGWSLHDYGDPNHPLQVWIREILGKFAGVPAGDVQYGIDNCAIPTLRLPIVRSAQAFARLATARELPEDLAAAAKRIVDAMTTYPEMVGGEGRFDTVLMSVAGGTIVSKGGAEAFQGIGLIPSGLGIAIKISDGSMGTSVVALGVLRALHTLDAKQREQLTSFAEPEVRNHQGELVGRVAPLFTVGEQA